MSLRYKPQLGKPLTPTETDVMLRVVENGETIMEISRAICKSPSTIATHLYRIKAKLGAKTTEQAAVFFDRTRRGECNPGADSGKMSLSRRPWHGLNC